MEFERPTGKQQGAPGDWLTVGLSAEWVCPRWEAPSRGGYTSLAWPIGAQSLSQAAAPRELTHPRPSMGIRGVEGWGLNQQRKGGLLQKKSF